ncbi:MAG TPA: DUF1707 domain-containing protein [Streptosporangiaceae bacterium]
MAYDPNIRASDADRDRVATLLREHHAAGRLTAQEFSERLDKAFDSRTVGDLNELLKDLPGIDLYRLPDAALSRRPSQLQQPRARRRRGRGPGRSAGWRAAWGSWFTVTLILFVVWLLSGGGYVWPLWAVGPWGAVLAGSWITSVAVRGGSSHRSLDDRDRPGELPGGDDLPGRPR